MSDDVKIDVGDGEEVATEINLDAEPIQEVEEQINVEQVSEDSIKSENTTKESDEQSTAPKDELEEYSEGVQKRIAKLTRKMREAERQKEEAIAFAQTQRQENEKIKSRFNTLDSDYTKEFERRVVTNLEAVKGKLATAISNGDIEGQVQAQAELSGLAMESTKVAQLRDIQETKKETVQEPVKAPVQPKQQAPIDPQADAWASKNPWFGSDNAMTYTAFDIHKTLVEEEGYDPQSDDYYAQVDKRIRLEFPHKFDKISSTSSEQPVQNVASARRPATTGRRKTVKLTPSQVAISKRLGVPLEEYAKQLSLKEV
jgi:hypothetical protein|tara:strand:- start:1072 stop:2013 length:942 start_codon:yes stop_codon:yes gene_type:complete